MFDMTPLPLTAVTAILRESSAYALSHIPSMISALQWKYLSHEPVSEVVDDRQNWSLCKFRRADRHYYRAQFAESLTVAVNRGDLNVVRWIFQHFRGCAAPASLVEAAASAGHLHILKFLLENGRSVSIYLAQENNATSIGYTSENGTNTVFWGGRNIAAAAKRGHGEIVRWLYEHVHDVGRDFSRVMVYTVRRGDLALVEWLLANVYSEMPQLPPPTINNATRGGHLHMVLWLLDHGYVENVGDAFRNASMSGCSDIVKLLVERDVLENVDDGVQGGAASGVHSIVVWLMERNLGRGAFRSMYLAAINGNLEVAQYVHAKGITNYEKHTMYIVAERGYLDVVKWLYSKYWGNPSIDLFPTCRSNAEGYPQHSTAMDAAASNGHLAVLEFLHSVERSTESSPECKKRKRTKERGQQIESRAPTCTRAAMTNAAAAGHLAVVKWLHEHRSEGCSPTTINIAARNGHLEVVKWLHENIMVGCTTAAMDGAAANGHLDVVQWLHEHRTEGSTTIAMDRAAGKGHLHVVQWLHANRTEGCTSFAMDSAARSGHLNVVQWLHRHRAEGCTDNALDGAAYNGYFNIVQWLNTYRSEGCTIDAMHFAAVHGHFEIVLYLHEQRTEGCSRYTAVDAAARGNNYIVAWLKQHYPKTVD